MRAAPWSRAARPLRFALTGGVAALAQLAILHILTARRWAPIPADAAALLLSTQVNFALSYLYTWRDRRPRVKTPHIALRRWATYQGSVAGTALLNMGVFVVARADLHTLAASALGTAVAAVANFIAGDRLVFRAHVLAVPGRSEHTDRAPRGPEAPRIGMDRVAPCREEA